MYIVFRKLHRWCGAGIYTTDNPNSRATAARELALNFAIEQGKPLYVGSTQSDFVDCLLRTVGGQNVKEGADGAKVILKKYVIPPGATKGCSTYDVDESEITKYGVGKKELERFFKKLPHAIPGSPPQILWTDHLFLEFTATDVTATEVTATEVTATEVTATEFAAMEVAATEVAATDVTATEVAEAEFNIKKHNMAVALLDMVQGSSQLKANFFVTLEQQSKQHGVFGESRVYDTFLYAVQEHLKGRNF